MHSKWEVLREVKKGTKRKRDVQRVKRMRTWIQRVMKKADLILNQNKPFRGEEEGENKKSRSRIIQCDVETYGLHS